MREKEKAPTREATRAGATETGTASRQATTSISNSNTDRPAGQAVHIADLLSPGPENGVTLRHLEKLTDMDNRTIRRQIERERRGGALILSDNKSGYFLASDSAEAQRFTRSMKHRAREILRTARAIEEAAGLD